MNRPLRVLVLSPHHDLPVIASEREATVHECHDLADMLGRAAAGAADVAIVAADCAGLDATAVALLAEAGCPVIGVTGEKAQVEQLRRLGITNIADGVVEATRLRAFAQDAAGPARQARSGHLVASHPPASHHGPGRVVAVWGPPGAPGRTTVARSLVVAAQAGGRRAVFLDADTAAGEAGFVGPGGLGRAVRLASTGRLDGTALVECCRPHPGGGWELAGPGDPLRWSQIAPRQFRDVLGVARSAFDVVVIDVGQDIRPPHPAYDAEWAHDSAAIARAAVGAADARLAVLLATPGGVARFASWSPVLREQEGHWLVVANRVGGPGTGSDPAGQVARVLAELGHDGEPVLVPDGEPDGGAVWASVARMLGVDGSPPTPAPRRRGRILTRWGRTTVAAAIDRAG